MKTTIKNRINKFLQTIIFEPMTGDLIIKIIANIKKILESSGYKYENIKVQFNYHNNSIDVIIETLLGQCIKFTTENIKNEHI